jgi:hypothetical protein
MTAYEDSFKPYGAVQIEQASLLGEMLLGQRIDRILRLSGGGDNGMFEVQSGGQKLALKIYRNDTFGPRDRLKPNWRQLPFFARRG